MLKKVNNLKGDNKHESVYSFHDEKSGLKGFIAIYNSNFGHATGGTRYWSYDKEEEALEDALRLSKAMAYKCALANLPFGGGKGVIIADSKKPKNKRLLEAYAERVNALNGRFSTGEDVGMTLEDIEILSAKSKFINGHPEASGDPSPWAALGVFYAIEAALEEVFGSASVEHRKFALKGLGKVGMELCGLLYEGGGKITVADIDPEKVNEAQQKFPKINMVDFREIHKEETDVYSPCAMGGEFDDATIPQLKCKIICGSANNQLATSEHGQRIHERGVLYIPDYLANAGGLINIVAELDEKGYSKDRVEEKIKEIKVTARKVIELSRETSQPTNYVADRMAEKIFQVSSKII